MVLYVFMFRNETQKRTGCYSVSIWRQMCWYDTETSPMQWLTGGLGHLDQQWYCNSPIYYWVSSFTALSHSQAWLEKTDSKRHPKREPEKGVCSSQHPGPFDKLMWDRRISRFENKLMSRFTPCSKITSSAGASVTLITPYRLCSRLTASVSPQTVSTWMKPENQRALWKHSDWCVCPVCFYGTEWCDPVKL